MALIGDNDFNRMMWKNVKPAVSENKRRKLFLHRLPSYETLVRVFEKRCQNPTALHFTLSCFFHALAQTQGPKIRHSVQKNNLPRIPSPHPCCIPQRKRKHVNPQHKVKQFSVIKITSVWDMEISRVPVSKSLGNCVHLYNQMSSESLGEFEKVRMWLRQSHAAGSAHFSWQHVIKDRGVHAGHHTVKWMWLFLLRQTREGGQGQCLIYDARHERDLNCTLWVSVKGVDRAQRMVYRWKNQVSPHDGVK